MASIYIGVLSYILFHNLSFVLRNLRVLLEVYHYPWNQLPSLYFCAPCDNDRTSEQSSYSYTFREPLSIRKLTFGEDVALTDSITNGSTFTSAYCRHRLWNVQRDGMRKSDGAMTLATVWLECCNNVLRVPRTSLIGKSEYRFVDLASSSEFNTTMVAA